MPNEKKIKFHILIKTTATKFSKKFEHRSNEERIFSEKSFYYVSTCKKFIEEISKKRVLAINTKCELVFC